MEKAPFEDVRSGRLMQEDLVFSRNLTVEYYELTAPAELMLIESLLSVVPYYMMTIRGAFKRNTEGG